MKEGNIVCELLVRTRYVW